MALVSAVAPGPHHARQPGRWARRSGLAGLYGAALLLGTGSALLVLKMPVIAWPGQVPTSNLNGPWQASSLAGSADADAYTRARVALGGLLALNRSETLYYVARHDSAGQVLKARCRYQVSGPPPPARWWSITAYADDLYLFAQGQGRYSLNSASAATDAKGRFQMLTGPQPPTPDSSGMASPWLPTPGDHGLVLTLRLYNPDPHLADDPQRLQAPTIAAVGDCR